MILRLRELLKFSLSVCLDGVRRISKLNNAKGQKSDVRCQKTSDVTSQKSYISLLTSSSFVPRPSSLVAFTILLSLLGTSAHAIPDGTGNDILPYNVGIGTTRPFADLQVDGVIYLPPDGGNIGLGTVAPAVGLQLGSGTPGRNDALTAQSDAYITGDVEIDGALYVDRAIYGPNNFFIGPNGNVGIRTTTPTSPLQVSGQVTALSFNGDTHLELGNYMKIARVQANDNLYNDMGFFAGLSNQRMVLMDNGYFGIGTTLPFATLQVDGAIYAGTTMPSHSDVSLTGSGDAMFAGDVEIDGALYVDGFIYGNGSQITGIPSAAGLSENVLPMNIGGAFVDSKIYGDANGNLGIGTTTPLAKFHLASGDMRLSNNRSIYGSKTTGDSVFVLNYSNGNSVRLGDGGNTNNLYLMYDGSVNPTAASMVFNGSTSTIALRAGASETMRWTNGNVGINTSVPAARLHIDGAIYASDGTSLPSWSAVSLGSAGDAMLGGDVEIDGQLYVDNALYVAGNLGIGLANPQYVVDINTSGQTQGFRLVSGSNTHLRSSDRYLYMESGNLVFDSQAGYGNIYNYGHDNYLQLGNSAGSDTNIRLYGNTNASVPYVITFQTQSVERMRIQAAGNIGIGVTNPGGKLVVDGTLYNMNGNVGVGTSSTPSALTVGPASRTYIDGVSDILAADDIEADGSLYAQADSYIGGLDMDAIHLTADADLYVKGAIESDATIYAATDICITGGSCLSQAGTGSGDIEGVGSMNSGTPFSSSEADDDWLGLGATDGRIEFDNLGTDEIRFQSANVGIGTSATKATLDVEGTVYTQGNVGIKTASPFDALHVVGNIVVDGDIYAADNPSNRINVDYNSIDILTQPSYPSITIQQLVTVNPMARSGMDFLVRNDSGSYLINADVDGEVLTVAGNIGIGSGVPGAKLVVDGTIYVPGSGNVGVGTVTPVVGLQTGNGTPGWVAMTGQDDIFAAGDVEIDGALYVDGFIYGNGSQLTGVTVTGTDTLATVTARGASASVDITLGDAATTYASSNEDLFVNGAISTDQSIYSLGTGFNYFAGNVGIGTVARNSIFEIYGQIQSSNGIYVKSTYAAGGAFGDIGFKHPGDSGNSTLAAFMRAYSGSESLWYDGTALTFWTSSGELTAASEKLRISKLGNVGIGVTNPGAKLVVDGTVYIPGSGNVGVGTVTPVVGLQVGAGTPGWAGMTAQSDAYVAGDTEVDGTLYVDTAIYGPSNFVVLPNGNVGIGTARPQGRLSILHPLPDTTELLRVNGSSGNAEMNLRSVTADYTAALTFGAVTSDYWSLTRGAWHDSSSDFTIAGNTPQGHFIVKTNNAVCGFRATATSVSGRRGRRPPVSRWTARFTRQTARRRLAGRESHSVLKAMLSSRAMSKSTARCMSTGLFTATRVS